MSAIAIASGGSALTPATGNINLFVATTGSDSNDGSAAHPFATIGHAISVALSFEYQSLYKPNIMLADATYHENVIIPNNPINAASTGGYSLEIQSTSGIPANVLIAPNSGADTDAFAALNGLYHFDGFTVVADPGNTTGNDNIIKITNAVAGFNNININTGSTSNYSNWLLVSSFARVFTNGSMVISGNGANSTTGFFAFNFCRLGYFGPIVFSSVINMGGQTVFASSQNSNIDLSNSIPFTTPGSVTNGIPLVVNLESTIALGADPVTVTWPGGAFDPTQIDGGSNIDGNFYTHKYAGAPVDETSIYRSSWQIHKDANQTTAGLGLNLYVDDAGTVVPLIALTPAPGNLTFFVATTGSNSNPGTSGSPFATIQHAVSVALSFDYQSLYTCTINVASGTYHENVVVLGLVNSVNPTTITSIPFSILGSTPATPTNTVIAPNSGAAASPISFLNGNFKFDAFSLQGDTTSAGSDALLEIINEATVTIPTGLDFNMPAGAASLYSYAVRANLWSRIGAGGTSLTFQGTGWNLNQGIMNGIKWSNISFGGSTMTFNSAIALGAGLAFFAGLFDTALQLSSPPTFVNVGNVTGGTPISLISGSQSLIGVDPLTVTWPCNPFDPTQIDGSSNIDGFFYGIQNAGQLVDETSIYRGSWRIFKDTTNVRRYIAYDDGGTIYANQIGRVPNTQSGTPYVLALSDQGGRVEMNNAGANQLTVPANATVAFPIGTEVRIVQVGAGATTIAGAVGVTVDAAGVVGGQWKSVMLYKRGTNEWVQTNV